MNTLLRWILARRKPQPGPPQPAASGLVLDAEPAALYAVGDVHGHIDLYRQIEARIAADPVPGEKLIVLLGDIVDRGPDSAGMIDHLLAPPPAGVGRICLLGNHEDMALQFLLDPDPLAEWLVHGGAEMLASYGIARGVEAARALSRRALAMRIAAHIPGEHIEFLQSLPLFLRAGPHFLSHAGVDAALPLEMQTRRALLWSRQFIDAETAPPPGLGPSGLVVQGHLPIESAAQRGWRINVDTGAYVTGRLSAVRLQPGLAPVFLSVGQ
ncbi:MAG: metallophosphoesterase [Phaeovulum sp.]|uniref:metallophosphoesterase n=1 Tax=Phaeovulum sp. TaxID=2934796 RepID=UPI0027304F2A|nr:metallophosphoesterase [Phaeovulum sp.]MDP2062096.1 metallophosphoesterase [Phaeovulum sp.]